MKKLLAVVITLIFVSGAYADFYVDGSKGSDKNCGSIKKPFKTIEKAKAAVREKIKRGMTSDITVAINGGKYFLDSPLSFGSADSGRDGHQVIYRKHGNQPVEIIGGKPLSGWEPYKDHIYKVKLDKNRDFHALFENGQWAASARSPNKGYLAVADANVAEKITITYQPGDLPEGDYSDAGIGIWAGAHGGGEISNYDWFMTLAPIISIDASRHTLTLENKNIWNKASKGNRYFVQGALVLLDSPGEWYLDPNKKILYYWPRQEPINQQEIIAPTVTRIIDTSDASMAQPAENITFDGLTFACSDGLDNLGPGSKNQYEGGIYLIHARKFTVRNCQIRNLGINGIVMYEDSQGHIVTGNLIENCGYCGIMANGFHLGQGPFNSAEAGYLNKGHLIDNNYIRSCGKLVGHGCGLLVSQSGDIEISHNRIEDMPRYGINMYSMAYTYIMNPSQHGGYNGVLYGQKVTWENHMDFLYTRNIKIVFNEFRDLIKDSADAGAITFWSPGANNLIANNWIHHLSSLHPKAITLGVYLDDASKGVTVKNNIITDIVGGSWTFPICVKGQKNIVTNNLIANNEAGGAFFIVEAGLSGLPDSLPGVKDEKVGMSRITRNIIYRNGGTEIYRIYPWREDILGESDYNLYYHPQGEYTVMLDWKKQDWKTWQSLLDKRFEQHSVYTDPGFKDPSHYDFTFSKDSPAAVIGFEPIDMKQIGLKADFPFPDALRGKN
jgi:hypothetical protein